MLPYIQNNKMKAHLLTNYSPLSFGFFHFVNHRRNRKLSIREPVIVLEVAVPSLQSVEMGYKEIVDLQRY
jgi:hypothetical protein